MTVASTESRKTRAIAQTRSPMIWGGIWFVLLQLLAIGLLEWKQPEFYDPKYGCRLKQLRARLSQDWQGTLLVVLGSSRAEQGFRPGLLPAQPGRPAPVIFNLARGGSSPLLNLLTLRRLLADGIRPDWVVLEIFPPSLVPDKYGLIISKPTLRDIPLLWRYVVDRKTYAYWLRDRLLLWHKYRSAILAWLPWTESWQERLWAERGGEWSAIGEGVAPEERRHLTADARRRYFRKLQDFHIAPEADRALRDLLCQCRQQSIGVILFMMPEASEFRHWYAPPTQERLCSYLGDLEREYRISLIDARHWIADSDFYDGHHLLLDGAAALTRRLSREIFGLAKLASPIPNDQCRLTKHE